MTATGRRRATRSATPCTTAAVDQAVYAFAREDLDWWEGELGREIRNGQFAENLTTSGIDVNEAEVGERWRVGTALLEVAMVRIPCNDFKNWQRLNGYDDRAWVKRFARAGRPGPYLRVIEEGEVQAGDELVVVHRPGHGVTVSTMFRALTTDRSLLPRAGPGREPRGRGAPAGRTRSWAEPRFANRTVTR